ncbi:hypothetical protein D9M68_680060 [compost metagenome]
MQFGEALDRAEQAFAQAGLVGAAGRRGNQVDVGLAHGIAVFRPGHHPLGALAFGEILVVGAGVLLALEERHHQLGPRQRLGQIAAQAVLVLTGAGVAGLLVDEGHLHAGQQHGLAAQQMRQLAQWNVGAVEVFGVRPDAHAGAGLLAAALVVGRQGLGDIAALENQTVDRAIAPHHDFQARSQGVGDGNANAVQAAGEGVGAAARLVELAARVQAGEHQFHDGSVFFGMQADGNAAPVVLDGNAAVRVQRDLDLLAVAGQCLVCGVINDLLHDVQGVFGSGVHARALAHGLQPLQDANGRLGVTWSGQVIPNICGKKPTFYG